MGRKKAESENTEDVTVEVEEVQEAPKDKVDDLDSALDAALADIEAKESGQKETLDKVLDKPEPKTSKVAPDPVAPEEIIEAPTEFNAQEKEAWAKGDRKSIRQAWDRVNQGRLSHVTRLENEHRSTRELVQSLNPYIEAAGYEGKTPQQAVMEALAFVNAFRKDPASAIREVSQMTGLTQEQIWNAQTQAAQQENSQIVALQNRLAETESFVAQENLNRTAQQFGAAMNDLTAEMNNAGTQRYPDLQETEAGMRLAHDIGSLIRSEQFVQTVRNRIPGASYKDLFAAAYKTLGGRVDDSEGTRFQGGNQKHVLKSRRAASSQPGRSSTSSNGRRKFASFDDAIDAALEDLDGV